MPRPIQGASPIVPPAQKSADPPLRFFFMSDSHAGFSLMERFVREANREKPDLILDGGDFVEEGTEPEFKRAYADRAKLESPLKMVTGNHDVLRRGPFTGPVPEIPPFQSFDRKGVHFILLDNEDETLTDELFDRLEQDLEANKGKTTIVAMHVPPFVEKEAGLVKLRKLVPVNTATPAMKDPAQVKRFTDLMEKYGVAAVLAGHTHAPSQSVRNGVQYVVAGAVGGKTPGPGIAHEYLDITVRGKDVQIKRVPLDKPPRDPLSYLVHTGAYIAEKNRFNHAALGWDEYVPATSAQVTTGPTHIRSKHGETLAATVTGQMEYELDARGKNAAFAEGSLGISPDGPIVGLGTGLKHRVVGDYNRSIYLSGAGTANAGLLFDKPTAGVGVKLATGAEWQNFTIEVGHERATNRQATTVSVGYRW